MCGRGWLALGKGEFQLSTSVGSPKAWFSRAAVASGQLSLRRNASWVMLGNGVHAASRWGIVVVLARLGGADMIGQIALAIAVCAPVSFLAKLGLRSALVTDAVLVADMPPGSYGSGSRTRMLGTDGSVRLKGTPYLAGSALTLDKAVLNVAAHCDVSFETAWAMASTQPAEMVGLASPKRVEVEVSDEGFARRA